ncbi:hypothetical protein L4D76_23170 [Photobacterium sagamiensis]|uniref:hypothetical protein n=1 Tax=Photobacterium sagamiensis TaxID=2910241 RepID=UPI003D10E9FD
MMNNLTMKRIHKTAAIIAFLLIISFFTSSVLVDVFGDHVAIAQVKQTILYSVGLLVLAMMTTGISANQLYRGKMKGVFAVKQKRMKIAAANGVLILIPAAVVLARWSGTGQFDSLYWTVQGLELIAGATNATLLGLNIRDGIAVKRHKS